MKLKSNILPIILIIGLLIGVAYFTTDYFALSGTPVYVNFENLEENPGGYTGKFYVGDYTLSGNTRTYHIIPSTGPSDKMTFQIGWTESKIQVPLEEQLTPIQYKYGATYAGIPYTEWADVPYYNLDMNNRKIVTKATIKVDPVDGNVITKYLSNTVDPDSDTDVSQQFSVKDEDDIYRTIYIRYTGLNFYDGQLPPATAMSTLKQGDSTTYQLVDYTDLERAIEDEETGWNNFVYPCCRWAECTWGEMQRVCPDLDLKTWNGVYKWMIGDNRIEDECEKISGAEKCDITLGTNAKIDIDYDSDVFTPSVTFYVPEELGYMVIVEQIPELEIDPVDTIRGIEGGTTQITITGTAKGSGSIDLDVDSGAVHSVNWDGSWPREIEKGNDYTFTGTLHFNVGLDADKYFDARVISSPVGSFGESTYRDFQIYLSDKDTAEKYDLRVYAVYKDTTDVVTTAELYAGYDTFIGYGDATRKDVPAGSYVIYSDNVTGWYAEFTKAHPKTVDIDKDTTVVITFTEEPPETDGYPLWAYIIFGVLGVVALLFVVLILKEAGIDITVGHLLILLAIIVFAGLMWYGISMLERLIEALENFKLFGS